MVEFVKKIATDCGWDGKKTAENRKFLSDLKDLLTEWNDVPWKNIAIKIAEHKTYISLHGYDREDAVFFIDVREPVELARYKKEYNAITILIENPNLTNIEVSNHADANVRYFEYDYYLINGGSLEDLQYLAKKFCQNTIDGNVSNYKVVRGDQESVFEETRYF